MEDSALGGDQSRTPTSRTDMGAVPPGEGLAAPAR